jgi:hypothetical protein
MTNKTTSPALNPELSGFHEKVKETAGLGLRSKAAQVRRLLPEIERLGKLDYTHERLCEVMTDAGLELNVGTFRSILARIKADDKKD